MASLTETLAYNKKILEWAGLDNAGPMQVPMEE